MTGLTSLLAAFGLAVWPLVAHADPPVLAGPKAPPPPLQVPP